MSVGHALPNVRPVIPEDHVLTPECCVIFKVKYEARSPNPHPFPVSISRESLFYVENQLMNTRYSATQRHRAPATTVSASEHIYSGTEELSPYFPTKANEGQRNAVCSVQ